MAEPQPGECISICYVLRIFIFAYADGDRHVTRAHASFRNRYLYQPIHAAPDVDAVLLNAVHALKERTSLRPHIRMLLGFAKRVFVLRLYPNEDVLKIG